MQLANVLRGRLPLQQIAAKFKRYSPDFPLPLAIRFSLSNAQPWKRSSLAVSCHPCNAPSEAPPQALDNGPNRIPAGIEKCEVRDPPDFHTTQLRLEAQQTRRVGRGGADERLRIDAGSAVQSVLFPAPGFGRDFYYCSFAAISRVGLR